MALPQRAGRRSEPCRLAARARACQVRPQFLLSPLFGRKVRRGTRCSRRSVPFGVLSLKAIDRFGAHRLGSLAARRVGLALAVMLLSVPSAQAFQLFGLCLIGNCEPDTAETQLIDPKPYRVDFELVGGDEALADTVRGASALWSGRNEPAAGSAGLLSRAKADYRRMLAALYNEARYGGEISIRADGRQVVDLPLGHEFADGTLFVIRVEPSGPFAFGDVAIANRAPPTDDPRDQVEDPAEIGFVSGAPARAGVVRQAESLAIEAWRQQGHPLAEGTPRRITANHPQGLLHARLGVEPGPHAVFGNVTVDGTERMIPSFVARQTGLIAGTEYDPDDIDRARRRLQRLGVFSTAAIREGEAVGSDGSLPVSIMVQERPLRRIGAGASFSTIDGFGASAFWLHRNLWGRAERLRIEGGVSDVRDFNASDYNYRFGATLGLPGRFTPDTDITLRTIAEREVLDSYTRTGLTASVGATHYFSDTLTFDGGLLGSYAEFDDANGTRRLGIVGVELGATLDTRDEPLDATRGYLASARVTPFYEWVRGNPAVQMDLEGRAYRAFGEDERTVVAGRVKLGSLVGPSAVDLPPDRLYFTGGGSSVRGYRHRSIGAEGDTETGGKSLIEGSLELRQAITETIGVVGFADAALVGTGSVPDFGQAPLVGAGLGVRYQTGLGPLRLDVATPLNPRSGDPVIAIYAGIGEAF